MSRQVQLTDVLRKEVRSLLMAAKEGLTPAQLEQEYLAMIGRPLPLHDLGFQSTMELVADMPEVVRICPHGKGTFILKAVADETTKDIAKLIAKQKTSVKTRNAAPRANALPSSRNQQKFPRRGRTPPVLPAAVKSELKDLLSSSPVLLSDFNKAFSRRFGRAFKYMQYGFFSMLEMLSSVSDIIAIEQSRAGSLLTLKKSPSTEEQQEKTPQAPAVEIPPPEPSCETESSNQTTEEKSEPEETQAVDFGDKLKQLEKDFKIMLCEKGAGGTVSSALKEKIQTVVAKYPDGLLVSKLHDEFEAHFKENLCVGELGFVDMLEFVGSLHDVLHVECKEDEQDWLVFDLKSRCLTEDEQSQCEDSWRWSPPPPAAEVSQNSSLGKPEDDVNLNQSRTFNVVTKSFKPPQGLEYSLLAVEMTTSEIPPDAVQNISLSSLPLLEKNCLVGVFVEFIISPSQFYIQVYSRETSDKLQDLMIEMRRCYSNKIISDRYIMPESSMQPGQLCCVMISEDKWWYRVIIHRVLSDQEVEVFYADFGNLGTVQKSWLRFLKWCYLKLPAQAVACSLAWVKPVEGTWTDAATLRFRKLCGSKLLVGIVDEYVNGVLHLFLCDTSSEGDVYFHSVLKDEGHAEVCRENIPSQGFEELNPLALYVQPSAKQGSAGLGEPDVPLQQECLCVDNGTASSSLDGGELCDQDGADLSLGMPYLEPVYVGSDFWNKNGLPLPAVEKDTCVSGEAVDLHAVASSCQSVSDEGSENQQNKEQLQQEWHLSANKEMWDDVWPFLDQVDIPRTTDEEAEVAKEHTNENTSELMTVVKTPHSLGESSKPAVLPKPLEDFYISLIYSNQPAEMSQDDPGQTERCSNKAQLLEAVPASVLLLATPFILDQCNNKVKNEDLPKREAVVLCSASRLADQEAHQKLYVPPTSPSATLGAAARLAASSGLFQWFPSLRKEM